MQKNKLTLTITLENDLAELFIAVRNHLKWSHSTLVREALEFYLAHLKYKVPDANNLREE